MKAFIKIVLILILSIPSLKFAQTQSIYITNQADSVSIYNEGWLVAKIFWPDNPIIGQNDTIDVSVNNNYLLPPSAGGFNYSLNQPLHFSLRTLATINFNWGVILRLYVDTTQFKVEEIISHINIYKIFDDDTLFTKLNFSEPFHGSDYVEFEILNISNGQNYLVVGFNLLFGVFNASQLSEPFYENVLVPRNKELTLNEGVTLTTNNYSTLIVRGKLQCSGSEIHPINFNQVQLTIWGNIDSSFVNNILQLDCNHSNMTYINQYYSNSILENCSLLSIYVGKYSNSEILNSYLSSVSLDHSKGSVNNCHFDSSYFADSGNSIFEIKNSYFEHLSNEVTFHNCLINLKNNTIYADAFGSAILFSNSLAIVEGNKLISTDDEYYNDGFGIYGGSFAILSRNIIQGKFRAAIHCGYGDTLVAYNNTILEGGGGFSVSSNVNNRMSFFNNIFYMQWGWDINLDYSNFLQGQNITYVDSNLSYRGDPYLTYYINNPQDSSIVYGNTNPIIVDPEFLDSVNCYLKSSSPAIDRGLKKIYSLGCQFSVLDTIVVIPDSINISPYYGLLPDLGAKEYDPNINVNDHPKKTVLNTFSLSQNFPNPFNGSSIIKFSIPQLSNVSIKVFNMLGETVKILVDEEKFPGEYQVEFNATELASGIYFYQLRARDFIFTKKMMLLK
ncbi:MAG: T9SS type A sorting domain-containing protein [Ignavibacteriaceae bacterium]|nr:T9SS type A sorting domain-containing protein [Ignavibacteriaceae bacterium]